MRLLVSVMNPEEAAAAVAGGADIVDVKDPSVGPLGAPAPDVIAAVRAAVPPHLPVSAALGDLPHMPGTAALAAAGAVAAGAGIVKVGLPDPAPETALQLLAAVVRAVAGAAPAGVQPQVVACAYADAAAIGALSPGLLPTVAGAAGCSGAMLDTYRKGHGDLLAWQAPALLADFVAACRAADLFAALAGSVTPEALPQVAAAGPDIIGVRGAACADGSRTGRIDAERVAALVRLLRPAAPDGGPGTAHPGLPEPGDGRGVAQP